MMAADKLYYPSVEVGYEPKGEIFIDALPHIPLKGSSLYETLVAGILCNTSRHVFTDGLYVIEGDPTEGTSSFRLKKQVFTKKS